MSARNDKLITAREAGEMLGLDGKTVLARRSGTESLTRVRVGKRGVRFSKVEVQDLVTRLLNDARQRLRLEEEEKAERQRQKTLRLVPPNGDLTDRLIAPFRK
ncbi:MAG TPA: hypothetical protein VGB07_36315 [Blastocatellia bacterium]